MHYLTDELRPAIARGPATAVEFADGVRPHLAAMTRLAARLARTVKTDGERKPRPSNASP